MLLSSYYVGTVQDDAYPACCILLTNRTAEHRPEYSPLGRNGPWWDDQTTDIHYRHGRRKPHFLVESDIPMSLASEFRFTRHAKCARGVCPESFSEDWARPLFMARAVSQKVVDQPSRPVPAIANSRDEWFLGWRKLEQRVRNLAKEYGGATRSTDEGSSAAATALLTAIGDQNIEAAWEACRAFRSADDILLSVRNLVFSAFGLTLSDAEAFWNS